MLEEISIASLGVIDEARLELGPGLTVVTGETGAGKTMVVTALGLLLGARADPSAVRQGAASARVEGRVRVSEQPEVAAQAIAAGAELDEDSLLLSRTVSAEGRSRARAGGVGVPAALLSRLAAGLVAVHGQSEQHLLLSPARQRQCLDGFSGEAVTGLLASYTETYVCWDEISAELHDVVSRARERARELDLLGAALAEIEAADPRPGEDEHLIAEEDRLAHADGLRRSAEEARLALSGDDAALGEIDALSLVALARKSLDAERHHDGRLDQLAQQLESASFALVDVAADIAAYAGGVETDPGRLAWIQERRASLTALQRKYGDTTDEVLAWAAEAAQRVADYSADDTRVEELRAEQSRLHAELFTLGGVLTERRTSAARSLEDRVTAELAGLAMPHSRLHVQLQTGEQPTAHGFDEVSFLLAADAGADPRSLQRGASGGELSRVMLAIEVCLAGSQPVPTMIFDEVDAGVGGKAAVEIGRRLARLSRSVQVIVVTHLPQVAAFADLHYVVSKSSDGRVTTSGVTALDERGRRSELSRMLAGLEGSDSALAHAEELVALAQADRAI